jgi:hypothetical protein
MWAPENSSPRAILVIFSSSGSTSLGNDNFKNVYLNFIK